MHATATQYCIFFDTVCGRHGASANASSAAWQLAETQTPHLTIVATITAEQKLIKLVRAVDTFQATWKWHTVDMFLNIGRLCLLATMPLCWLAAGTLHHSQKHAKLVNRVDTFSSQPMCVYKQPCTCHLQFIWQLIHLSLCNIHDC